MLPNHQKINRNIQISHLEKYSLSYRKEIDWLLLRSQKNRNFRFFRFLKAFRWYTYEIELVSNLIVSSLFSVQISLQFRSESLSDQTDHQHKNEPILFFYFFKNLFICKINHKYIQFNYVSYWIVYEMHWALVRYFEYRRSKRLSPKLCHSCRYVSAQHDRHATPAVVQ